jgi:formylglycine-generating enzyme required for sulfatase activity
MLLPSGARLGPYQILARVGAGGMGDVYQARDRSSRGGSWRHHVRWSSPSSRSSLPPDFRYADYGFRVLREFA